MISFRKKLNSKGFSHVELALLLIVVIGVSGVGYYVYKHGNKSHAGSTYTSLGSLSYDNQTFTEQACISAQSGTAPNQTDTVSVLMSADTEVGPSATTTTITPTTAQLSAVTAVQSALSTAENQLSIDRTTEANTPTAANAAAVVALTDRVNTDKTTLATDIAGEATTASAFNPSAYYEINGGAPVTEDNWTTGSISIANFDVSPTIQTADLALGLVGPNATYVGGANTVIGAIAVCNATSPTNVTVTSIGGSSTSSTSSSSPSQLSIDENIVTTDLTALNAAKAAIVDEEIPTAAQNAAITADNAAWVAAKNKVIEDEGGTVPKTTTTTQTVPKTTTTTQTVPKTTTTTQTVPKTTTTTPASSTTITKIPIQVINAEKAAGISTIAPTKQVTPIQVINAEKAADIPTTQTTIKVSTSVPISKGDLIEAVFAAQAATAAKKSAMTSFMYWVDAHIGIKDSVVKNVNYGANGQETIVTVNGKLDSTSIQAAP
jgi:hypothetical protein